MFVGQFPERCTGVAGARITSTLCEQLEHFTSIPAAEFLCLDGEGSRHHRGGDEAVAHRRIEIVGALAHALEMQARTFDRGDEVGRRACERGLRNFNFGFDVQRRRDAIDGDARFGKQAFVEIAARHRDAQPVGSGLELMGRRVDRAVGTDRVVRINTLHRVVGEREVAHAAGERAEVIEARHEWEGAVAWQPAVGRLQSEDAAQRSGHTDRPIGVGAERDRNEPAANRARRNRRKIRRSCGFCRAGYATDRRGRSRR